MLVLVQIWPPWSAASAQSVHKKGCYLENTFIGARVEDVPPQPLEGMSADGVGLFGEPTRLGGARVEGGGAGAVRVAGHREERARREREPERRRRRLLSEEGTPG